MNPTRVHPWGNSTATPTVRTHRSLGPQSQPPNAATTNFASPGLFSQGSLAARPDLESTEHDASQREPAPFKFAPPSEPEKESKQYLDKLLVRKSRRLVIVRTDEVQLVEAAGNYVRLITESTTHLLRTPLSELSGQLDPDRFLRVHRSTIINTECLEAVETNPAGDYFLRLPNGRRLKCSRTYRKALRSFLKGLG